MIYVKESIEFIKNYVKDDDYVVCATSGGVDSMTLLYLLMLVRKSVNINIVCAHINHNLREESKEAGFVKSVEIIESTNTTELVVIGRFLSYLLYKIIIYTYFYSIFL